MDLQPLPSLAGPVGTAASGGVGPPAAAAAGRPGEFLDALKAALDQVNESQRSAQALQQRFQLEDAAVSLEDVMVAMHKANIAFQAAVQVRNRLVAAYHDIMNMQV